MLVAILTACVLGATQSSISVTVPGMSVPDALELIADAPARELLEGISTRFPNGQIAQAATESLERIIAK